MNNSTTALPAKSVKYVALGINHSAAITKDGSLYMWGYNYYGELGNGTTTDRYTPVKIMDNSVTVQLPTEHLLSLIRFMTILMC